LSQSGAVSLDGTQLGARRTAAQRRAIQMIFQDPYSSLNPRLTMRRMLRELLAVHKLVPRAAIEERCRELVSLVGLPAAALDGLPGQFSGGQRQRIAIARSLAVEPQVLIADEPVSSLDVSVQATILRLFADLRDRLGLTMIIISHNLAVVRQLSDRVAVMYLGRVVEEGTTDELVGSVRHPYARAAGRRSPAAPARPDPPGPARRAAQPGRPAIRLPVPPALPASRGRLSVRRSAAPPRAGGQHARRGVSFRRGPRLWPGDASCYPLRPSACTRIPSLTTAATLDGFSKVAGSEGSLESRTASAL
jgi:ABC-type dipeptide/oligopeptide/nickel transport system ATPase subunit